MRQHNLHYAHAVLHLRVPFNMRETVIVDGTPSSNTYRKNETEGDQQSGSKPLMIHFAAISGNPQSLIGCRGENCLAAGNTSAPINPFCHVMSFCEKRFSS